MLLAIGWVGQQCTYVPEPMPEKSNADEPADSLAAFFRKRGLKIYTAFSPNNDGINDRWVLVKNLEVMYPNNHLQIFNRWGRLIFEANPYCNDWDGGNYPDGTYFFMIDLADGSNITYRNTLTIMR
jgi:gliding motility-associated-like protein